MLLKGLYHFTMLLNFVYMFSLKFSSSNALLFQSLRTAPMWRATVEENSIRGRRLRRG